MSLVYESVQADRPISVSELKKWMKCRLLWYFSAAPPRALGLTPTFMDSDALVFGRLAHSVLEDGYNGDRNFAEIYEQKVVPFQPKVTSLFSNQIDTFQKTLETGKVMFQGYEDWSLEKDKGIKFLATETHWKGIKIAGIDTTLSAIIDAVILRKDGLWLLDFKTTSSVDNPWTSQDLQATVYTYAGREAIDEDIKGVIFRFLLKKTPWTYDQLLLKDGTVTKRNNVANLTTYREYKRAIAISTLKLLIGRGWKNKHFKSNMSLNELVMWADKLVKKEHPEFMLQFLDNQRFYYEQLKQLQVIRQGYYWDVLEPRSNLEIKNYMNYVVIPNLEELTNLTYIGPTGICNAWSNCGKCLFKNPCKAYMKGQDYQSILNEDYAVSNHYLEDEEDEE
jgi:hypothetical protein